MQVSIIILNYNTFQLTSDCIRSVIRHTHGVSYEIILVDNASTEKDPGAFLIEFPGIILIRNPVNAGFAAGNNVGIAASKGEKILLLNSDTLLTEDSVTMAASRMNQDEQTGVLGCRMVWPDGKLQRTARRFRSVGWELMDLFRFIPLMMSYENRSQQMMGKYFRHDKDVYCDWVNGAFFMIRREVISKMPGGKLDERFFMYAEDHLWCLQAIKLGYRILFYAGTTIIHINSGSTDPARRLALGKKMYANELEIMQERKGRGFYFSTFRLIFGVKELFRNFVKTVAYRITGKHMR